jgi:hypothetical protein
VNNKALQFKVLCESDKGPVVIEHQNSTGVLFHISEKYQQTVVFMENFLRNKFNEVQNKVFKFKNENNNMDILKTEKNEKHEIPSIFKTYNSYKDIKKGKIKGEDFLFNKNQTNLDRVDNSRAFNRVKNIKSEASHVGFGINNRDMIFVENNYISQKPLFYMEKNKIEEETQFNMENILYNKIKRNNDIMESKNNFINIKSQKNDVVQKLKNLHIKIYNNNKDKKLKNRNIFLSYNHRNKINLNKDFKFENNNCILPNRNLNTTKKKQIRMNSANIFHKATKTKKAKTYSNLEYLGLYPFISNTAEKRRNNYTNNKNKDFDDKYDVYIPKYPRPANIESQNRVNTTNNNLNLLLLSNEKDNDKDKYDNNSNSYSIINNKLENKNLYFNSLYPRNITSFNAYNDNNKIKIKTIFY